MRAPVSESQLGLARRMVAATLNPQSGCGAAAALKHCQVLGSALIEADDHLTKIRAAWAILRASLRGSQGYVFDDESAVCICCGAFAATPAEIIHARGDCITADFEAMDEVSSATSPVEESTESYEASTSLIEAWRRGGRGVER